MIQNVNLQNGNCPPPLFDKVFTIVARQVRERTGGAPSGGAIGVTLRMEEGIGKEGYAIAHDGEEWRITGNDPLGLFYGVGRFLHEGSFARGDFIPSAYTGASLPCKPIRGIYMANPQWNIYGYAPAERIYEYIEDVLLWGCNSIMVASPGSGTVEGYRSGEQYKPDHLANNAKRAAGMIACANSLGMTTAFLSVANLVWRAPDDILADWKGGKNGYSRNLAAHCHMETCPSTEKGMAYVLEGQKAAFRYLQNDPPDYICLWPYDAGGCTCAACAPWGGNGYLRICKELCKFLRKDFPASAIILSTWFFDTFTTGEYAILERELARDPGWVDMVMAHFSPETGIPEVYQDGKKPGGLPVVDFPEISMYGMVPYGGFGANPIPARIERVYRAGRAIFDGGYPYSEGVFDDINKTVYLALCWGYKDSRTVVEQYCRYEFGAAFSEALTRAVFLMEDGIVRVRYDEDGRNQEYPMPSIGWTGEQRFILSRPDGVDDMYAIITDTNGRLPEHIRQGWRWQIMYLRAVIDYELVHNKFYLNDRCDAAFEALIGIYGGEVSYYTTPPSKRVMAEAKGIYDI